ncbi:hypothetical protein ACFORJ_06235 [Corynebacterium hansenii]|uniref:Uncharacterized protein n=1 Tax=Corynebacterium hansenii TaxID=394964 RepID=A0ABV7ZNL9_9CORY|nr:hypothetical protein [Corynebacterium hansenii]WJZ00344.1 hypothetical protein CHAN_08680 [Corynebacterium hansenii]
MADLTARERAAIAGEINTALKWARNCPRDALETLLCPFPSGLDVTEYERFAPFAVVLGLLCEARGIPLSDVVKSADDYTSPEEVLVVNGRRYRLETEVR